MAWESDRCRDIPSGPSHCTEVLGLRGQRPKPSGANEAHDLMKLCTIWTNLLERQVLHMGRCGRFGQHLAPEAALPEEGSALLALGLGRLTPQAVILICLWCHPAEGQVGLKTCLL